MLAGQLPVDTALHRDVVGAGQVVHVQGRVLQARTAVPIGPAVVELARGRCIGQCHGERYTPCGWPHLDVKCAEIRWQFDENRIDHGSCATDFVDASTPHGANRRCQMRYRSRPRQQADGGEACSNTHVYTAPGN